MEVEGVDVVSNVYSSLVTAAKDVEFEIYDGAVDVIPRCG